MEAAVEKIRRNWAAGDVIRDAGVVDPEGLIRYTDLRYGPHPENLLDVYCPEETEGVLPAIISIHGGGWVYGSKELYAHYCLKMAKRGFAVVNFDYRLAPRNKYPDALEDCCAVLQWVQDHGQEYHIDRSNLFVVGDSAGGQLAFQVLTMLTNPEYCRFFSFAPPENLKVNACGLNCGCYFMPVSRFLPPQKAGAIFAAYFPKDYLPCVPSLKTQKYVTKRFPPAFVMTSRNDYLRMMAPPLHLILKRRGVESLLRIYGTKEQKQIGHVFHLNCRSPLADLCNDEQAAFFRKHLSATKD